MKKQERISLSTAIYVRVSTEEQAQEGYSIRGQIEKLKSYALLKEWEIFDIYADEGISGKNIVDRPAVNKLIEDIKSGKVRNILVFKVDRLTRSTKNLIELIDLFEEYNCAFNSLTESIDTDTPSGRMFLKIIGIFAEFERENLSSRLKLGFERKVKEGYTLASYSFSYGYTKDKGQKIQTIIPEEAKIVKDVFSMYMGENQSMSGIARVLNARKVKTKRNGNAWDASLIKNMLTNPTYIGKVRYSTTDEGKYFEVDGHHEPIIKDDLFSLVQDKIKNMPNISRTKRPKDVNYFCGILFCKMCGSKFTTKNRKSTIDENGNKIYKGSYRCSKKTKDFYADDMPCKCSDISHQKIETAFVNYIKRIKDFSNTFDLTEDTSNTDHEQELLTAVNDCEKKLNNLQNRKKHVMEQYVNGEIEFDEYKVLLKAFNDNFEIFDRELQSRKANLSNIAEPPAVLPEDVILNIKENWTYLNNAEKMMFLQQFVSRITVSVKKVSLRVTTAKIENVQFNS
jgi:site-specific DNA recombinase